MMLKLLKDLSQKEEKLTPKENTFPKFQEMFFQMTMMLLKKKMMMMMRVNQI